MKDSSAKRYNKKELTAGHISQAALDELIVRGAKSFQKEQGLLIDGKVGPATQLVLSDYLLCDVPARYKVPTGKGVYIRSLRKLGTPAELVTKAHVAGLSFVAILSVWQHSLYSGKPNSVKDLQEYANAFTEAGISVWLWGYPYAGKEKDFVDILNTHITAIQAYTGFTFTVSGVIIDPEVSFKGKPQAAEALVHEVTQKISVPVGVSSYGAVWAHPTFPYEQFAVLNSWASPQVYDKDNNLGADYPSKSVKAWRSVGFPDIACSVPAYNKTPDQLKALLAALPKSNKAVIFWSWETLRTKHWKGLWQVISDYSL